MGRIIVPSREIAVPPLSLPTMRMGGYVRAQVHKYKSGTLKKDSGWFPNIITDNGVGYFANSPQGGAFGTVIAIFGQCAVGTGTGTPAVGDTTLFNYLTSIPSQIYPPPNDAGRNSTGTGYVAAAGSVPAYYWNQNQYVFPTGAAAGNLTEIGIFPSYVTYGSGLFSHALITDANGNPTTITVLSDEVLTVTYQCNFYIDQTDHAFSFPLNGVTNNGTYRWANLTTVPDGISGMNGGWQHGGSSGEMVSATAFYSGDIGAVTGQPSGSAMCYTNTVDIGNASSRGFIDFVNDMANSGTWYFDFQAQWPTGVGTGTMKSLLYQHGWWQYQFGLMDTPITKTSGQQMQMSLRASWGRY